MPQNHRLDGSAVNFTNDVKSRFEYIYGGECEGFYEKEKSYGMVSVSGYGFKLLPNLNFCNIDMMSVVCNGYVVVD